MTVDFTHVRWRFEAKDWTVLEPFRSKKGKHSPELSDGGFQSCQVGELETKNLTGLEPFRKKNWKHSPEFSYGGFRSCQVGELEAKDWTGLEPFRKNNWKHSPTRWRWISLLSGERLEAKDWTGLEPVRKHSPELSDVGFHSCQVGSWRETLNWLKSVQPTTHLVAVTMT